MLAYSSVAQVGFMLIGISTGTSYGLLGTFLHIFNHSLLKGMAFLGIGSIIEQTGSRDINSLQGISKVMPLTTVSLIIALLGLGGVPGTNGFISKFILFSSAIGAGLPILVIIGVLNSALSMAYYLRVIMIMVTGKVPEGSTIKEAPILMVGVTAFMALLIIILGIYPGPVLNLASEASRALIDGIGNYIGAVLS
jgi:formate hydrogenlyase subunit 3/multisubunit Na+/H+ antiporter MnhD subunit